MSAPSVPTHTLSRVVVLDTETGGLDPWSNSLLSIGLVSGDGAHRTEIFVAEPEIVITPESEKIHRLSARWIGEHGISPAQACEAVEAFLAQCTVDGRAPIIAGHNVAFDLAFLRRAYHIAGRPLPNALGHRTLDTHTLLWSLVARNRLPPETCASDGAFAHFGIAPPEEARHTALGDALATRDLLARLLEMIA
ncbi:MAG: exonuclease domain-containing protein [Bradymonadia bacterium]